MCQKGVLLGLVCKASLRSTLVRDAAFYETDLKILSITERRLENMRKFHNSANHPHYLEEFSLFSSDWRPNQVFIFNVKFNLNSKNKKIKLNCTTCPFFYFHLALFYFIHVLFKLAFFVCRVFRLGPKRHRHTYFAYIGCPQKG